ncbi:MAG: TIGR03862 family flavoprotein [Bacteroidota bacterium]
MIHKKHIAIIGGGPAALMLACSLDSNKFNISLYEKNAALGRKFLVAGKGGFNLTHSEELKQFASRYDPKAFIEPFLQQFSNTDFRKWLSEIGIETYVGTSKRVFPVKGIKPIEVLKAIENKLSQNQVSVFYQHEWKGWKNDQLVFENNHQLIQQKADITIFALGGASWKVTGSDGTWTHYFKEKNITVNSFYPSNCAYQVNWDKDFIKKYAGSALKNAEFSCGSLKQKGEAVLTDFGIEGSGVYPLSRAIREELIPHHAPEQEMLNQVQYNSKKFAQLQIDLKPDLSFEDIKSRLESKGNLSVKAVLEKKLNLTDVQIDLLKTMTSKEDYNDPEKLAAAIKALSLTVPGLAPIDDAISTVGGIAVEELTKHLELKKLPQHYCIGEMIDWDAPTGGYLLQACFSMGYTLAEHLNTSL